MGSVILRTVRTSGECPIKSTLAAASVTDVFCSGDSSDVPESDPAQPNVERDMTEDLLGAGASFPDDAPQTDLILEVK